MIKIFIISLLMGSVVFGKAVSVKEMMAQDVVTYKVVCIFYSRNVSPEITMNERLRSEVNIVSVSGIAFDTVYRKMCVVVGYKK